MVAPPLSVRLGARKDRYTWLNSHRAILTLMVCWVTIIIQHNTT